MSEVLNLEDVLALGGTKEDFKMLQNIDNEKPKKGVEKHFKAKEIEKLVGELGFDSLPPEALEAPKRISSSKKIVSRKAKKEVEKKPKQRLKTKHQDTVLKTQHTEDMKHKHETAYKALPKRLLIKTTEPWFERFQDDLRGHVDGDETFVKTIKYYAMTLFENEVSLHKGKGHNQSSKGNDDWINTVASAGTLSDRVASLSLMLHKSPVHNFHCFENLLAMAKKKGKREAIKGFEAIKDLLLGDLIPNNRKLRNFLQHPLDVAHASLQAEDGNGKWSVESCQTRLILWAFEHRLKELIAVFVDLLKALARDTMEVSKTKAMSIALDLLTNKPEQEGTLLNLLVNKLGDPKYKIASKALSMLNRVVSNHPMMQAIIVKEVRDLLLIPTLASRAQYYCVCFLSSQILSHDRKEVAQNLIQIYMSFFKSRVKKKNSSDNKMLSALLTGVNRAFPYANLADETIMNELDILFRTVHVASISTAIQSLVLIFQVYDSRGETSDRFNNALYAALFHNELPLSSHRHPMFLNLLYRALKADPSEPRVEAFVKRTLQACSLQLPAFCAAVLTMVAELVRARPSLECRFLNLTGSGKRLLGNGDALKEADTLFNDDEEEHFVDVKNESDAEEGADEEVEEKKGSWVHKHKQSMKFGSGGYDPMSRNPQYCGSEKTSVWELHAFTRHYHPTVAIYASKLLTPGGTAEPNKGDPLEDYTLIKFLDRFVYRNPKVNNDKAKNKKKQPSVVSIHMRKRHASFVNALPVNSLEFLQKEKFNPEEVFYQRYFSNQPRRRKRGKEVEITDLSDEEFDEFMNSSEGQKRIDQELNFSDHIYKNKLSVKDSDEFDDFDEDSDADFDEDEVEGYGFEMEDGEEDLLDDGGVFVTDIPGKRKAERALERAKRQKMSADEFGMMLEENTSEFDTTSSMAVSNKDQSSAKQMRWESKQQQKDALRKKKEWRSKERSSNSRKKSFKKSGKR